MRALAAYDGPTRLLAMLVAEAGSSAEAVTTTTVATDHAARACPTRPRPVWSGELAAATAPPMNAAMMPDTAPHTKAGPPPPAGGEGGAERPMASGRMPSPGMVNRI